MDDTGTVATDISVNFTTSLLLDFKMPCLFVESNKMQFPCRASFPDAVVIIGDYNTASNVHIGTLDRLHLQRASQDVIVVSVSGRSGTGASGSLPVDKLATDKNHILHISDMYDTQSFVDKIVPLLLQC